MTDHELLEFAAWIKRVDDSRTGDPLWSVQAYRLGVYAIECHSHDRGKRPRRRKTATVDQLTRSIGSIAANIAEGYSRGSLADRVRFYEYALGSVREAISWYDSLRVELGEVATARQAILIQIRRLLLTMLRNIRTPSTLDRLQDAPPRSPIRDD